MTREMIQRLIEEHINNERNGDLFTIQDFLDYGNYDAVKMALSRLNKKGVLIRVIRGVYQKPNYSDFLNESIPASPNELAKAYAKNYKWKIIPKGDTALNILGLSTQVPAVYNYASSGPYKKIEYNGMTIRFSTKTSREITELSYKEGLLIEAIKALGKGKISDIDRSRIFEKYSCCELSSLLDNNKNIRRWIFDEILEIIESNGGCNERTCEKN
ncbi:type IV toxin-antitoxin system AbiEi family antitoxin domain-containing protein [Clostridia bacterium]|nr:type IV toxin-antitoxin system AbiEi family antitoxin domain-containing protein [Clostridia bacterium]